MTHNNKKIKLLYLGLYYDYGIPKQGLSFEEYNFHEALKNHPDVDVSHFDFSLIAKQLSSDEMNGLLARLTKEVHYDALFYVLFQDDVDKDVMKQISRSDTVTIGFGCDDHWRFDDFSRYWAPCFNWWVTTADSAIGKFKGIGYENVIKSQWACADSVYYPRKVPRDIDVSFVGQPHGNRKQIISFVEGKGIDIKTYGLGWKDDSRISFDEMIDIFCKSKINLNLSKSSTGELQQIKGRVFEVPGCRAFLLTDPAESLEQYYEIGKDLVVYESPQDMIDKIKYYLEHDAEREKIAKAGYERTIKEHTWKHRFDDIFKQAGLL
jgi:spore maturation protein CgeB